MSTRTDNSKSTQKARKIQCTTSTDTKLHLLYFAIFSLVVTRVMLRPLLRKMYFGSFFTSFSSSTFFLLSPANSCLTRARRTVHLSNLGISTTTLLLILHASTVTGVCSFFSFLSFSLLLALFANSLTVRSCCVKIKKVQVKNRVERTVLEAILLCNGYLSLSN